MWNPLTNATLLHPESWCTIVSGMQMRKATVSERRHRQYLHSRRSHSQAELMIALRGQTLYGLGETLYKVRPGTVMAFAPMEPHQNGYPPGTPDLDHLWVSLMRDGFVVRRVRLRQGRMLSAPVAGGVYDVLNLPLATRRSLDGTDTPRDTPLELRRLCSHTLAACIVLTVLDAVHRQEPTRNAHAARADLIASIRRHLRQTAGRGDSLDSLARIAGYSRHHFLRLFHRETGETVQAYINRCRLRRMQEGLANGDSQKVIASELGFATPQAFSRWKRQHAPRL